MSDEVDATPAALAHAEALGVDVTTIKGSGAGGKVTKADVEAAVGGEPVSEKSPWFYCLDARHPGAREVIDDARFFQSNAVDCPTCPACGRQVTAVPAEARGVYPASLLDLAARLV